MTVKATYSTPLMHVADIETSIRFYQLLGFVVVDTDRCTPLGWARLHVDGGGIMFVRAERPIDPAAQGVMLCMYTPDLVSFRQQLIASGLKMPAIVYPGYMPSGELDFPDPDGFHIAVMHWGKTEQEAWEKRISENK
jgi:hypothetical protein